MSHIVEVKTKLTDKDCLKKALERLNVKYQEYKNFEFYDGTVKSGFGFKLPNWNYPIIIDENNQAFFDNYHGSWGDIKEFNEVKTYYGIEKMKKAARIKGYTAREVMVEGKPQVRITIG